MENNLLTHTKHETTHFDVVSDKSQTVSFLPFPGKINVKLNLSNILMSKLYSGFCSDDFAET